jgi:hypothetical protein
MAGSDKAKRKDGGRPDKKSKAMKEDVAARRTGDSAARPKTKAGVPKGERAGNQKKAKTAAAGTATRKNFTAAAMATDDKRGANSGTGGRPGRGK